MFHANPPIVEYALRIPPDGAKVIHRFLETAYIKIWKSVQADFHILVEKGCSTNFKFKRIIFAEGKGHQNQPEDYD
jgi:hypothetical protein